MQVTVKLNTALFELFRNEFERFLEQKQLLVTAKKISNDRTRLVTKTFMKIEYGRLRMAMTCYYTTSTVLIQSNHMGPDDTGAAMTFVMTYLVP